MLIYPGLGTPGIQGKKNCQTALGSSPKETVWEPGRGPRHLRTGAGTPPSSIQAKGMGVSTAFRGLLAVHCFPLSHLSNAEMCPWVVPKANRQWAGHSPKLDIVFALSGLGLFLLPKGGPRLLGEGEVPSHPGPQKHAPPLGMPAGGTPLTPGGHPGDASLSSYIQTLQPLRLPPRRCHLGGRSLGAKEGHRCPTSPSCTKTRMLERGLPTPAAHYPHPENRSAPSLEACLLKVKPFDSFPDTTLLI